MIGGNISILCASLATPYQPSFQGAILFLEDLEPLDGSGDKAGEEEGEEREVQEGCALNPPMIEVGEIVDELERKE